MVGVAAGVGLAVGAANGVVGDAVGLAEGRVGVALGDASGGVVALGAGVYVAAGPAAGSGVGVWTPQALSIRDVKANPPSLEVALRNARRFMMVAPACSSHGASTGLAVRLSQDAGDWQG